MNRASERESPVFTAYYDILRWLLERVEKFPKSERFVLGQRLANRATETLELLVEALYSRNKVELLRRAGLGVEVVRVLTRLCRDRELLSDRQYKHISQRLAEVGAMVGGWIKQQRQR